MRVLWPAAAAIALALPLGAHAAPPTAKATPHATKAAPNKSQPADASGLNERTITEGLKKAGYTDIKVAPIVFIARAIDKKGHTVLLAFRPHSLDAATGGDMTSSDDQPAVQGNADQPSAGAPKASLDNTDKVER